MPLNQAFTIALVGFLAVFTVLAVLMLFIKLLSLAFTISGKHPSPAADIPPTSQASPAAPGSCGEVKLYNVSDRDAAMIMAIVADEMNTPINELRFISIRETGENK